MEALKEQKHCCHTVSYTHLRAHETVLDLVCRLLLEKKKQKQVIDALSTQQHTITHYLNII